MTADRNEIRLTAYLLDELDGGERTKLESELEASAEMRAQLNQLKETLDLLRDELSAEPAPELTDVQRAAIDDALAATASPKVVSLPQKRRKTVAWLAAAAAGLFAVGLSTRMFLADQAEPPAAVPPAPNFQATSIPEEISNRATNKRPLGRELMRKEAPTVDTSIATTPKLARRPATGVGYGRGTEIVRGLSLNRLSHLKSPPGGLDRGRGGDIGVSTDGKVDGRRYSPIADNPFKLVSDAPLSTFSVDVDTASYANVRSYLKNGKLPPKNAVRIEEMINYFGYEYPGPVGPDPFAANVEVARAPWQTSHLLVRIGLKGREIRTNQRPPSNLVFLVDVSGSMSSPDKLPLLVRGLQQLTEQLDQRDRVAIVVYAGAAGLVLPSTAKKSAVFAALDRLSAGGSTAGGSGIRLAYKVAAANKIARGTNRVILATDGDFNVGIRDVKQLKALIKKQARSGISLSVLGFGRFLNDKVLETLADNGNGNYAFIDSYREAKKVLVQQMSGTLVTIAKDVKLQVEFNPARVAGYRLIGYENRMLKKEDFANDKKDAGDIGAGHRVTALYQVVPAGVRVPFTTKLKYQKPTQLTTAARTGELLTFKVRYKQPKGSQSKLLTFPVKGDVSSSLSPDFSFAAAVAEFGLLLRGSRYMGQANLKQVLKLARDGRGKDRHGYRKEFIALVQGASRHFPRSDVSVKQ